MFPTLAVPNPIDQAVRYSVPTRHPGPRLAAHGSDSSHLGWRQLRCRAIRSAINAPLAGTVPHVVRAGAKEEMIRADALPVVALVTDHLSGWDCAARNFPRHTMNAAIAAPIPNHAVSVRRHSAGPLPASGTLADLRPKPRGERIVYAHRNFLSVTRGRAFARCGPTFHCRIGV